LAWAGRRFPLGGYVFAQKCCESRFIECAIGDRTIRKLRAAGYADRRSSKLMDIFLPTALAALARVVSVTEGFAGSSKRLS